MRKKNGESDHKYCQLLSKDKYSKTKEDKVDKIYLIDQYVSNLSLFMVIIKLSRSTL